MRIPCGRLFQWVAPWPSGISLSRMRRRKQAVLTASAFLALVGCASRAELRPEPETPPQLFIEDQSADAPPPPPPAAPPPDANAHPDAAARPAPTPAPAPPANTGPAPTARSSEPPPPPPNEGSIGSAPDAPPDAPPNAAHWAYEYPTGRWVYANGYGWMWVPASAATVDADGVPYAYLYTPRYGWTWYVSPWGVGVYRYGGWVRRPWHPVGWHGAWVAHPRVVVRLGGPRPRYYGHRHRGR